MPTKFITTEITTHNKKNTKLFRLKRKDTKNISISSIKEYYKTLQKSLEQKKAADGKTRQVWIVGRCTDGSIKTIKSYDSKDITFGDNYSGDMSLEDYDPVLRQFTHMEIAVRDFKSKKKGLSDL